MKRTCLSLVTAATAVALLASACATEGDDVVLGAGPGEGPDAPVVTDDPAAVADAAVVDVEDYWRSTYPDLYGDTYQDVAGFYPYGPDTEMPSCGPYPLSYEEIADNAFYCPDDDIIAWDEASLMPALNQEFGMFTVAMVIAHEFGHAIQERVGTPDRTVDLELQADCFAGAWTQRVADGDADGFEPDDVDLDKAVAGLIAIRDVPGTDPDDMMAHGLGFDRVSAFQDGYEGGAESCVDYADPDADQPTSEFFDEDMAYGGGDGNLPLEDGPQGDGLYTVVEQNLNDFYDWYFEQYGDDWTPVDDLLVVDPGSDTVTCGGDDLSGGDLEYVAVYCEEENTVVIDGQGLAGDLYEIGDFAVASEIAQLWALAAQSQFGTADDDDSALQADCLTGYWGASVSPDVKDVTPDDQLVVSAGDLDEGLMGFLAYGTGSEDDASVFERANAARTGYFGGYDACEEYGPLG